MKDVLLIVTEKEGARCSTQRTYSGERIPDTCATWPVNERIKLFGRSGKQGTPGRQGKKKALRKEGKNHIIKGEGGVEQTWASPKRSRRKGQRGIVGGVGVLLGGNSQGKQGGQEGQQILFEEIEISGRGMGTPKSRRRRKKGKKKGPQKRTGPRDHVWGKKNVTGEKGRLEHREVCQYTGSHEKRKGTRRVPTQKGRLG